MDAIRKIELALAALHPEADSPWTNLDKSPYIHKTDDKQASPWSCAVVGRFDYLPTMDYMLACQPSAIRELLATHTAELAAREAEIANQALNYVSLFGELQNAVEDVARLRSALRSVIDAADSPIAQGGEMWFAEAVFPAIEDARAAILAKGGDQGEGKS